MKIIAIAAVGRNGELGKDNKLPWNIPEDMEFFKKSTEGHTVVMGRRTFESLGRPLPNRRNIVLSTQNWSHAGVEVIANQIEVIRKLDEDVVFVIGGENTYTHLLPYLDEIWLTEIDEDFEADTYFPGYKHGELNLYGFYQWEKHPQKKFDHHEYFFCKYVRHVV
jgi:dihydrofolate reductase